MARNNNIDVHFTKEEKEKVVEKARSLGMKAAAFLRFLALSSNISVEHDPYDMKRRSK